jgi:hypothetical protein
MLKKLTLTVAAMFVLAIASTAVFAQDMTITEADIPVFLKVYADPSAAAVSTAVAGLGADAQRFAIVNVKLLSIYGAKQSGLSGDALATQLAAQPAPATVTAEEIAIYDANEAQIKDALDKFSEANMPK